MRYFDLHSYSDIRILWRKSQQTLTVTFFHGLACKAYSIPIQIKVTIDAVAQTMDVPMSNKVCIAFSSHRKSIFLLTEFRFSVEETVTANHTKNCNSLVSSFLFLPKSVIFVNNFAILFFFFFTCFYLKSLVARCTTIFLRKCLMHKCVSPALVLLMQLLHIFKSSIINAHFPRQKMIFFLRFNLFSFLVYIFLNV